MPYKMNGGKTNLVLTLVFAALLVTSLILLVILNQKGNANPYASVQTDEVLEQYVSLAEQNEEMVGWVKIEHTGINFPVMQTPSEEDFYLNRDFGKQGSIGGLVFVDKDCTLTDPSLNIVLYAGVFDDGTGFSSLWDYQKESYRKDRPVIQFHTLYEMRDYEVFAVVAASKMEMEETVIQLCDDAKSIEKNVFDAYITGLRERAMYETDVNVSYGDELLTLCTYTENEDGLCLAVVARKR